MKSKTISAKEFDRLFDEGADISSHVDRSKARGIHPLIRRVNVDFPYWMVHALDDEAERLGVTRQSVIKAWIAEMIERRQAKSLATAQEAPARRRHVAEPPARYRAKKRRR
jgi:hypothetical protein